MYLPREVGPLGVGGVLAAGRTVLSHWLWSAVQLGCCSCGCLLDKHVYSVMGGVCVLCVCVCV